MLSVLTTTQAGKNTVEYRIKPCYNAHTTRKGGFGMPISENKKASNARYTEKCDYINVRPLKAQGQKIRAAAAAAGQSLQGYILQAVEERMERDAQNGGTADE